jgi:hypothetical protein
VRNCCYERGKRSFWIFAGPIVTIHSRCHACGPPPSGFTKGESEFTKHNGPSRFVKLRENFSLNSLAQILLQIGKRN